MEGRPIRGEGVDHEQDYIRERIEQAGDTDEYAEASRVLQDEVRDLQSLSSGTDQADASPALETLQQQASTPIGRQEFRQGAELDASSGSQVDVEQNPPEAEAQARTVGQLGGGSMGDTTRTG